MAAYDVEASLKAIESFFSKSGHMGGGTMIGEPKVAPEVGAQKAFAAVWMHNMHVDHLFVGGPTVESHQVMARVHVNAFDDSETLETELAHMVSTILADLLSDASLGSEIMTVDSAGMLGTPLNVDFGHVDIGGSKFRVADILIPLIVNDSATVTP